MSTLQPTIACIPAPPSPVTWLPMDGTRRPNTADGQRRHVTMCLRARLLLLFGTQSPGIAYNVVDRGGAAGIPSSACRQQGVAGAVAGSHVVAAKTSRTCCECRLRAAANPRLLDRPPGNKASCRVAEGGSGIAVGLIQTDSDRCAARGACMLAWCHPPLPPAAAAAAAVRCCTLVVHSQSPSRPQQVQQGRSATRCLPLHYAALWLCLGGQHRRRSRRA